MDKTTDLSYKKILIITGIYQEGLLESLIRKEKYSFVIAADKGLVSANK